jgi:hypothetical protein
MKIPETELLKNDPDLYQQSKIHVIIEDENAHMHRGGPLVALHFQKIKRKMMESDLKNEFKVNEMRSAADKKAIEDKKRSMSIKDIRDRAQQFIETHPTDKIELSHIQRNQRFVRAFEKTVDFQINTDL